MSTVVLKLVDTDSEFIERIGSYLSDGGESWYYMPFWFKKIKKGLYVQYKFDELPDDIKKIITENRL